MPDFKISASLEGHGDDVRRFPVVDVHNKWYLNYIF